MRPRVDLMRLVSLFFSVCGRHPAGSAVNPQGTPLLSLRGRRRLAHVACFSTP